MSTKLATYKSAHYLLLVQLGWIALTVEAGQALMVKETAA